MLLIGLGHRARQGKDLAAESIRNYYDAKNAASLMHVASWKGSVRVGVFKYATALYQEVTQWLSQNPNWQFVDSGIVKLQTGVLESEDGELENPNVG